jgi:uncharacterized pyridoxal phosphate-containing UPF0001 family protein
VQEEEQLAAAETPFAAVRAAVSNAAMKQGRRADQVRLIAVTKTYGVDAIEPVLRAGHRDFGENRVQEAQGKWPALRQRYPDLRLHLIGPLQTNKVRDAVALFDAIHSVDRDKLAAPFDGNGAAGPDAFPVRTGEYGGGAAEGRSRAGAKLPSLSSAAG